MTHELPPHNTVAGHPNIALQPTVRLASSYLRAFTNDVENGVLWVLRVVRGAIDLHLDSDHANGLFEVYSFEYGGVE